MTKKVHDHDHYEKTLPQKISKLYLLEDLLFREPIVLHVVVWFGIILEYIL